MNQFPALAVASGLPEPTPEVRFHPIRKWRFDWAFPHQIAVEIQGGTFVQGRHSRDRGQRNDMAKLHYAQLMGWHVVQVTPREVESGEVFERVREALAMRCSQYERWQDSDVVILPKHLTKMGE